MGSERISPSSYWRTSEQRLRLVGSNCSGCGRKHFPPRDVCPECGRSSFGPRTLFERPVSEPVVVGTGPVEKKES